MKQACFHFSCSVLQALFREKCSAVGNVRCDWDVSPKTYFYIGVNWVLPEGGEGYSALLRTELIHWNGKLPVWAVNGYRVAAPGNIRITYAFSQSIVYNTYVND
jgi:hypothetical protein